MATCHKPHSLIRYPVHVRHARHVPLADVVVERRPCDGCRRRNRWVEQVRHARHRCSVPVGDRTVRRRRSRRIGHPRNHGRIQVGVGDGRQRSDVRGEEEEQREAREAVRPPRKGPSARERHDVLHRGAARRTAVCAASSCNEEHKVATLTEDRASFAPQRLQH